MEMPFMPSAIKIQNRGNTYLMSIDKFVDKIHDGKCEELIPLLPDNSIDLVVTSPPYNVDLGNNKYNKNPYDTYQDNKDHKEYIAWLCDIFRLLKPKMVIGGRVCINIGDSRNGSIPTHSDVIQFMTNRLKYLIKTTIIWDKSYLSNRASWGSWKSPSNPSFPTPFEYILVFCNETQHKEGCKTEITVNKDEFITNSLALWKFKSETKMNIKHKHPAMFPIDLPYRLIQQLSYSGDVVLDIFSGMGTTCLAAAMLDRRWIGFELSSDYTERSIDRIRQVTDQERIII